MPFHSRKVQFCIKRIAACSGDRYDGKWEDGEQSGVGVFTWADGSSYNGFWRDGRKHGVGVRSY